MKQYQTLLRNILEDGQKSKNRTGTDTTFIFGHQSRYDLQDGFPAVTTKKLAWKAVVGELLWFLEGSTDERRLAELTYGLPREELVGRTTIWTANADAQGKSLGYINTELTKELGPVYGAQWRNFNSANSVRGFDQIMQLLHDIHTSPDSRRLIISGWNPSALSRMALPPCHITSIFSIHDGKLSCMLTQRSADAGLGSPFNIASYALLTHIIAKACNLDVGEFVYSIANAHIYENHIDGIYELLAREPYPLPTLQISPDFDLIDGLKNGFRLTDASLFTLKNYNFHPTIKMDMAV